MDFVEPATALETSLICLSIAAKCQPRNLTVAESAKLVAVELSAVLKDVRISSYLRMMQIAVVEASWSTVSASVRYDAGPQVKAVLRCLPVSY